MIKINCESFTDPVFESSVLLAKCVLTWGLVVVSKLLWYLKPMVTLTCMKHKIGSSTNRVNDRQFMMAMIELDQQWSAAAVENSTISALCVTELQPNQDVGWSMVVDYLGSQTVQHHDQSIVHVEVLRRRGCVGD